MLKLATDLIDPRRRLVCSCVLLLCQVLLSPLVSSIPHWLTPMIFFSGGCAFVDFFVLMQAVTTSLGAAIIGSAWGASDERPICTKPVCSCGRTSFVCGQGGAKAMVSMVAHHAIVVAISTGMFRHADSAWATILVIVAVSSISSSWLHSFFEIQEAGVSKWQAWLGRWCLQDRGKTSRECPEREQVSAPCWTVPFDHMIMAARILVTAALLGFLSSVSAEQGGCDAWRDQLEVVDPSHRWPSGLDLTTPGAERDRVMDVARMSLMLSGFTAFVSVFLAVSLLLELKASAVGRRRDSVRSQVHTMKRAVAYVNHHTRGPLNAAVLCMTLLEPDGQPARPCSEADVDSKPPSTDSGSSAPSTGHLVSARSLRLGAASCEVDFGCGVSMPGSARLSESSNLASQCSLENPDSGGPPTRAMLRDLRIALESSKQELDDLLLWQRLSRRKTTTLRSWGTMGSSWEERLSRHFASHRRAAALTLDIWGCRGGAAFVEWELREAEQPQPTWRARSRAIGMCEDEGQDDARRFESPRAGGRSRVAPEPVLDSHNASAGSSQSGAPVRGAAGPAFPWAILTDHARIMQAAVAMVAIGTYAAAARSSRFKPGRVCVSVSVSTGRGAMAGLQWPQPLAPRRGMRGSERGALCVEVRFTGQGYSAAELEGDPFDPFGRLRHGDDSLSVGPTGLRLAVVRGVAVSLGGEAGLGSGGAESGAHVWLRVPVAVVRRSSEAWYDHWHGEAGARATRQSPQGTGWTSGRALAGWRTSTRQLSGETALLGAGGQHGRMPLRDSFVAGQPVGLEQSAESRLCNCNNAQSSTEVAASPLSGWRVWIADDDDTTARVAALVARRSGAATRTFADGAQLVAAVEAAMDAGEAERGPVGAPPGSGSLWELPDGVLVDGHMPVMGGVEAIRAIVSLGEARAPWWRPRLWLVTGEATPRVESEASRAGADGVLCKPVTGALVVSSLLSQAP